MGSKKGSLDAVSVRSPMSWKIWLSIRNTLLNLSSAKKRERISSLRSTWGWRSSWKLKRHDYFYHISFWLLFTFPCLLLLLPLSDYLLLLPIILLVVLEVTLTQRKTTHFWHQLPTPIPVLVRSFILERVHYFLLDDELGTQTHTDDHDEISTNFVLGKMELWTWVQTYLH